ncbi:helix-turn-helix domain-containing protein [Rubellimicrobium arenae]|uniref:helix-turn-helix domain-containing protein n=1 Tax=Rubellimicrobium arenae TaxID=2817372 RepID=UPI001B317349|nr:helix-turn-helix transcriptional regulator [Rubellimicrobium arenae]
MTNRVPDEIPASAPAPEGASSPREAVADGEATRPIEELPVWAANLQHLTRRSGLTQAELARRAGLQRDAFGRYLLGRTRPPPAKLVAIAKALGVRPADIDPERGDLEEVPPPEQGRVPFRITPAYGGGRGRVFLEVAAEMDIADALRIVELMTKEK